MTQIDIGGVDIRRGELFIIAGPCVIESLDLCVEVATAMKEACGELGLPYVFKASFDKANRTSVSSFRGPGLEKGLEILGEVKAKTGVAVITDIHLPEQAKVVAEVADALQIPAFLSRQTDLLLAAGFTGLPVNVKKAQFMAPWDMGPVVEKAKSTGNEQIMLTERGVSFGYNTLVVDMSSIAIMRTFGVPVIIDGTHSVQKPGGLGGTSGGDRTMVPTICRAGVAAGADGVFLEVHPKPDRAKCDATNSIELSRAPKLIKTLAAIKEAVLEAEGE